MKLGLGADDLAGLDARGAELELLGVAAAGRGAHRLDVLVPAAVGPPVRVGHVVAEARSLATDVAHASHGVLLNVKALVGKLWLDESNRGCPNSRHPDNLARLPDGRPGQPIAPGGPRPPAIVGAG